jgi:hypothetical protein
MKRIIRDIESDGEIYSVIISFDENGFDYYKSSCTCKWGSWYGHTKKNREMMKVCKHIKNILEEIKNGNKNNKNGN